MDVLDTRKTVIGRIDERFSAAEQYEMRELGMLGEDGSILAIAPVPPQVERFAIEATNVLNEAYDYELPSSFTRGLGIEINTSGVFGPGVPYPARDILVWAREAGVPVLTLGTDSHSPKGFANGLVQGVLLARDAGWRELTLYEQRAPSETVAVELAVQWATQRLDPGDSI